MLKHEHVLAPIGVEAAGNGCWIHEEHSERQFFEAQQPGHGSFKILGRGKGSTPCRGVDRAGISETSLRSNVLIEKMNWIMN